MSEYLDLGMVIAAGGSGSRFSKTENKLLADFRGKPLLIHSLEMFLPVVARGNLIVAAPENLLDTMRELVDEYLPGNTVRWTPGGATRVASVANAVRLLDKKIRLAAIHDAARPLADCELLDQLSVAAREFGGAIPGIAPVDTVKAVDSNGMVTQNLIRKELALVSTPQVFDLQQYLEALDALDAEVVDGRREDPVLTDDAAIFMRNGGRVKVVFSSRNNLKITLPGDILA